MQRTWRSLPLAALALVLLAGPGRSQEAKTGPLERKALDLALYNNLRDVINRGADLYNSGDWAGCYRLYEGSLMVVKPLLDHRPALQKAIGEHITSAERNPLLYQRAFVLREVIDQIRDEVNPNPTPKTKPEQKPPVVKTLWDRLGGEKGVTKIVNDLVRTVSTDPKVDWTRGGRVKITPEELAKMKKDLVAQISSWTGGPLKYNGPDMKEVHKTMGITDAQYDAFEADLKKVLELNDVAKADVNAILKDVESYRKQIVQAKVEPKPATLWARLGEEKGVKKIIDDLVDAVAKDPKVDVSRGGKFKLDAAGVTRLKRFLVEQVSSLTGGPLKYEGLNMKEAHKGMGITNAEFDAFMDDVKKVLADNKVAPADAATLIAAYNSMRKDIVAPAKKPEEKKPEEKKPPEKKPEEKKPPEKKPEEKKPEEKKPVEKKP
jgi:hemoglobin